MSNMPSSLSDGRYQLGQLVGRGGMAEVHVAVDTRLGRTVAIKIMRSDLANDEIFLKRFRREAHSVAQMNNPNIVNIYDSGEEIVTGENGQPERLPYLVMEYVKGQTLRDIIRANGPLSQRDAEQVMLGVLNALEYSHRMGIIHRDIKPGNIMISDQGMVKVMDFGIARALDDSAATMTQSQGVVGTAQYLSPEQARGESVDMRSDLYSAGCVLYEMLTGKPPFTGDSAVAIAYQHVSEVATPPSAVVPGLPKMWDSICAKAMAKDRQNRYATAAEFKNDILTFMNGGMPVAASFNPLTDLSNMKARKQAEQDAATQAMSPAEAATATQAFNPVTGQFEAVMASPAATRAAQREAAAKARRKKKAVIGAVIGVIVAVALALGLWFAFGAPSKAEQVTVPEFNAMTTQARAEEQLNALGLKLRKMDDTKSTEPEGTFTRQDPAGGAKVDKGSTVRVWFSTGPKSAKIPDVKGYTQEQARKTLTDAGFKVSDSVTPEDSATVERGKVTRTNPAAGMALDQGQEVTLFVSNGMTSMPDVTGKTQEQARKTLTDAGFGTIDIQHEYSATVPAGSVIRMDPAGGTPVSQGTTVTIWVSDGAEKVTVPDIKLNTETLGSALSKLQQAGFAIQYTNGSSEDMLSVVTNMNPAPGTQADKGSTVTITTQAMGDDDGSSGEPDDPNDIGGRPGGAN